MFKRKSSHVDGQPLDISIYFKRLWCPVFKIYMYSIRQFAIPGVVIIKHFSRRWLAIGYYFLLLEAMVLSFHGLMYLKFRIYMKLVVNPTVLLFLY